MEAGKAFDKDKGCDVHAVRVRWEDSVMPVVDLNAPFLKSTRVVDRINMFNERGEEIQWANKTISEEEMAQRRRAKQGVNPATLCRFCHLTFKRRDYAVSHEKKVCVAPGAPHHSHVVWGKCDPSTCVGVLPYVKMPTKYQSGSSVRSGSSTSFAFSSSASESGSRSALDSEF